MATIDRRPHRHETRLRWPLFLLAATLLAPGSTAQAEDAEGDEIHCRRAMPVCGGVLLYDEIDALNQADEFDRLAARLLADPGASAHTWRQLLELHADKERSEETRAESWQSLHWQAATAPASGLDRLTWLELWRRHHPRDADAWRRWAREKAEVSGESAAVAELESALAAAPENEAIRESLLHALMRAGDRVRLEELLKGAPPDPELERRYAHLPVALRPTYALASSQYELDKPLDVLRRALRDDPQNTQIEIEALTLEYYQALDEGREAEVEARFRELAGRDLPIGQLAHLCDVLRDPEDTERCRHRLEQKVREEGLHLISTEAKPPEAASLSGGDWQEHLLAVREAVVEESIASADLASLRQVLTQGSGYGYGDLWQHALELAEPGDRPENGARSPLAGEICGWLERALHDGSMAYPIDRALGACPQRADSLAPALERCGLHEEIRLLREKQAAHVGEFAIYALADIELPPDLLIAELERRLESDELSYDESRQIEWTLQNYLVEAEDAERLIAQGRRILDVEGDLSERLRRWLDSARDVPGVEDEILRALLPRRPQDHLLRLRLAHHSITGPEPDLELAERLAESVATAEDATVRERAEAHYLLGRLAVLAGDPEDATPHLAHFYDLHLENAVCPAHIIGCDRDYPLHLIATGDWPRLEAYQSRKAARAAERRAAAETRLGDKLHATPPVVLERMRLQLIHQDPVLHDFFLEPACGLPVALPHLQALLAEHPEDPDLQDRHAREQARSCHREGPRPWSRESQPLAADLEAREAALLLSARHP